MSARVVIIGAGSVGRVVAHKCAQLPAVFGAICLASRTLARCDAIAATLPRPVETAAIDAEDVPALTALLRRFRADLVINVALPYQDLAIMDACLAAGAHYVDTANYEPRDVAKFEYRWQWAYRERFRAAGLTALLGSGFDPGVTNVFCAHARKHHFDTLDTIDILDCNAGDHGLPFATNFNPEINLREITAPGRFYEDGRWHETAPLAVSRTFDFPGVGPRKVFLLYHEELESLALNLPGVRRLRFWMTFSENYLTHLRVLQNVGLTRIDPIPFQGRPIVPLEFLKALLPDPATLGPLTKGKTCIGCLVSGTRAGAPRRRFTWNTCDHQEAFRETGGQAIAYTTGVPAMVGAKLVAEGAWRRPGVFTPEELDPDPFLADLARYGLPWHEAEWPVAVE
ncbi:MAG: hypothetical protein RLZZ15_2364 [Verrucomicrobiota bacterium]|jgi:saccharopine dehydrogenase (NAD+, L-lysine-forming)